MTRSEVLHLLRTVNGALQNFKDGDYELFWLLTGTVIGQLQKHTGYDEFANGFLDAAAESKGKMTAFTAVAAAVALEAMKEVLETRLRLEPVAKT